MIREEIKIECDCCYKEISKREIFKNDGSYQKDYLKVDNKDVCFTCAGKILDMFFLETDKEKIKDAINNFAKRIDPLSINIEKKSLF